MILNRPVVIRGSKSYRIVSIIAAVANLITILLMLWYQPSVDPQPMINENLFVVIVVLTPLEIALVLMALYFNVAKIHIESAFLIRTSMFGKKTTYKIENLSYQMKSQRILVYINQRRVFNVSYMYENFEELNKKLSHYVPGNGK